MFAQTHCRHFKFQLQPLPASDVNSYLDGSVLIKTSLKPMAVKQFKAKLSAAPFLIKCMLLTVRAILNYVLIGFILADSDFQTGSNVCQKKFRLH